MLLKIHPKFSELLDREADRLNKVRMRILSTLIIAYAGIFFVLGLIYIQSGVSVLMARVFAITVILMLTLRSLLDGKGWRLQAHIFICCLTFIIWTNLLFIHDGVNLINMQYIALIMASSFYLLEEKWGFIYSCINLSPVLIYIYGKGYGYFIFNPADEPLNKTAYHIILGFNIAMLVYVHYFFFKEYKLIHTSEKEKHDQLQKAYLIAENTAEEKTNFLATMSHELRTPLNAVIGITHLLQMEEHLERQKENLNILQFSATNLMTIINDILDFNKITAQGIEITPVDFRLDVLVKHLCGTFKDKATAKGLTFDCSFSPKLKGVILTGDQNRITQILFNLIGNAVKFTLNGNVSVYIDSVLMDPTNYQIRFTVSDTGIGIPKEQLSTIFEPYQQSKVRTNRQYHGTGLGLTIAQRLVELLGGKLQIRSEEGVGTSFSFALLMAHVRNESERTVSTAVGVTKDIAQMEVLVAEDNPINIMVIKKILNKWGINPQIVENGQLAVEAVKADRFDVVLMDINMPVMDGFEASRLIRELPDESRSTVPIIALTASIGAGLEHHQGFQYLTDCVLKPFKPEELRLKLENIYT